MAYLSVSWTRLGHKGAGKTRMRPSLCGTYRYQAEKTWTLGGGGGTGLCLVPR